MSCCEYEGCERKAEKVYKDYEEFREVKYCWLHVRMKRMVMGAKGRGQEVPEEGWLVGELVRVEGEGMKCPHCGEVMEWDGGGGRLARVVTLQHDRSGGMRLLCLGCNARHRSVPGDLFYDIGDGEKYCPGCGEVKGVEEFESRGGKRYSRCGPCRAVKNREAAVRFKERTARRRQAAKDRREAREKKLLEEKGRGAVERARMRERVRVRLERKGKL